MPRRIIASSRSMGYDERMDLPIHVLAQLPDTVTLDIHGDGVARHSLERLARAYAIEDRVRFERGFDARIDDAQVVYPSSANAAEAPIRPRRSEADALLVETEPRANASARRVRTAAELIDALSRAEDGSTSCRTRDELFQGQRIAVVTNLPTHYRVPLLNALSVRLARAGASLHVLFSSAGVGDRDWMKPEPFAFDHAFLSSRRWPGGVGDVPLDLERRLRRLRPTLVLAGGFSPAVSARVARIAPTRGLGFGVWSGEIGSQSTARSRLRRVERRWLLGRASFAISYGHLSAEYLRTLAPSLPVVYGRNPAPVRAVPHRDRGSHLVEVLAVARALPRKGLDVLIDAFRLLHDLPCRLTLAGGGPALPGLKQRASGQGNVRILGAVPSDRVPDLYAEADIFAFPSRTEVFGLALIEGMGSGCASVVSSTPGAVADVAVHERNCLILESHEPLAWAGGIRRLVEDPLLRTRLGSAARTTIAHRWTMEHAVDAMAAGLRLGVFRQRETARA